MKKSLPYQKKALHFFSFLCMMLLFSNFTWGQTPPVALDVATNGDYRTAKASGNWNDTDMWQVRSSGSWAVTSTPPTATNTVYIQSGHSVTVTDASVSCYSLHINTTGVLAIGANIVNVNGKIRCFTGLAETSGSDMAYLGTDSTATAGTMITTSGVGVLKFVGSTRSITFTSEWDSSGTSNAVEFALTAGQTGTLVVGVKFKPITFSSGIITTSQFISASTGDLTIKSGATLITSRSTTGGVIGNSSSVVCGTVTIDAGGILELTGSLPTINCTTFVNNGTIKYTRTGTQTLLTSGTVTGTAGTTAYNNYSTLVLGGTSAKTLAANITIANNGTLSLQGTNTTLTGSFTVSYGTNATLEYAKSSSQTVGIEWPATDSPANITFKGGNVSFSNGSATSILRTVTGVFNLNFTASTNSFTVEDNSALAPSTLIPNILTFANGSSIIRTLGAMNLSGGTYAFGTAATDVIDITIAGTSISSSELTNTPTGKVNLTINSGVTYNIENSRTVNNIVNGNIIVLGNAGTLTLTVNGTLSGTGTFTSNINTATTPYYGNSLDFTNSGAIGTLYMTSSANEIRNLSINGNLTLGSAIALNNSLNLTAGTLSSSGNLTLRTGATISRAAGSLDANPVFGSTVNVTYNGTTATTSSFEQPTTTSVLSNLTINNTAGVTLTDNTKVNGVLTLTSGTLTIGSDKNLTLVSTPTITAGTIDASTINNVTNTGATVTFENPIAVVLPALLPLFTGNVQNLTINGAGGVTLGTATSLAGKLTVTSGVLTTEGFLTLKSSDCCTASVGELAAGAVTGNVTVERYIPSKRAWRALTAPVSTTASIFENWQENGTGNLLNGFDIWSQAGGNGLTGGGTGNSMLSYNSTDNNWTGITATNTTGSMMNVNGDRNKPFMAFVTGPYGSGNITNGSSAATTLRAKGALLIGDQTYSSAADKYTFIGNPYASPLSLSAMLDDIANDAFVDNIWIWQAIGLGNVGVYNTYDPTAGYTNTTNSIDATTTQIQSGQAFFVKSTAGGTFTIKEIHKGSISSPNSSVVFRDATPAQLLRVGLYKQSNTEWLGRDGAMTVILPDADANQSPNKMANGTENVAFTKNAGLFASNHHLPLVASDVLNVKVWNTTAGANYKLKINTERFATTSLNATLEDLFTNSRTPITLDGTAVEYPFAVTTEAASTGNRFRIVFENSTLGIDNPKATGISILPNPITGDTFQVNFGTLGTGTYSYSICNALGQEVEKGSINNVAQNTNSFVKFKNNTAAGMYIIKVTGTDNTIFTAKIIKK